MKRIPLSHRLRAKICACILLVLSVPTVLGSLLVIMEAWNEQAYTTELSTAIDREFRLVCMSMGDDLVLWLRDGYTDHAERQTAATNGAYRVTSAEGTWQSSAYSSRSRSPWQYRFAFRFITEPEGWSHAVCLRGAEEGFVPEEDDYLVEAAVDETLALTDGFYWTAKGLTLLWKLRYAAFALALLGSALSVACFVFLLFGAGHRAPKEELSPGPLTKVPFDLFTVGVGLLLLCLLWLGESLVNELPFREIFVLLLTGLLVVLGVLLFTGWCVSLAARLKLGGLWRGTLLCRLFRLIGRVLRFVGRGLLTLLRGLPLVWRTVLLILLVCLAELLWIAMFLWDTDMFFTGWIVEKLLLVPAFLYLAVVLRRLQKGGQALAAGDLRYHTDTSLMPWDFRRHGEDLNSIALGMSRAVEQQLRSERLKTELITNVSHDIKTPLTSIINYVDLLRRNEDPERSAEYLEVLDRQSKRLKKLTEDLVEVSKASTGNMEVHVSRHSVSELLYQALGEYSERLSKAGLEPVLALPPQEVFALADGALVWRVLDNLFSNVCKYAQPGTRFYLDVWEEPGWVLMSFKNISRERLNLPAEELMERFVRGDSARSGEGSGLGLNIARSLTELQGGSFFLSVDGDLFKVQLVFPAAPPVIPAAEQSARP